MDLSFNNKIEAYYQKFIELQDKLRKSEEDRLRLEMKFNEMVQMTREEEQSHYRKLRSQYKRFLDEDRKRQERNERIVRTLERIETRVNLLSTKTERFKLLRHQYQKYLQRISRVKPTEQRQNFSSRHTVEEPHSEKMAYNEDFYRHPSVKKALSKQVLEDRTNYQPKIQVEKPMDEDRPQILYSEKKLFGQPVTNILDTSNEEKIAILDKYLQNLSSQQCKDEIEKKKKEQEKQQVETNQLKYFDEVAKKLDDGFNSNQANSIAEDIMNSIYSRHYKKDKNNDDGNGSKYVDSNYINDKVPSENKNVEMNFESPIDIPVNVEKEKPYEMTNDVFNRMPEQGIDKTAPTNQNNTEYKEQEYPKVNQNLTNIKPHIINDNDTKPYDNKIGNHSKIEKDKVETEKKNIIQVPKERSFVRRNSITGNKSREISPGRNYQSDVVQNRAISKWRNVIEKSKSKKTNQVDQKPPTPTKREETSPKQVQSKTVSKWKNIIETSKGRKNTQKQSNVHKVEDSPSKQNYQTDKDQKTVSKWKNVVESSRRRKSVQRELSPNKKREEATKSPEVFQDEGSRKEIKKKQTYENIKNVQQVDNILPQNREQYNISQRDEQHKITPQNDDQYSITPQSGGQYEEQQFQYDNNQSNQYDQYGQPIQYDQYGNQYDENGQLLQSQYDSSDHQTSQIYDTNKQPLQSYEQQYNEGSGQYNISGQPIQYEEHGETVKYTEQEQSNVHSYDQQNDQNNQQYSGSESLQQHYDDKSEVSQFYDDQVKSNQQFESQPSDSQYEERGQTDHEQAGVTYDRQQIHESDISNPQYNENDQIQYDESSYIQQQNDPQVSDTHGQDQQQYDENPQMNENYESSEQLTGQYDQNAYPVQYDQNGQPIQYDQNEQPIQYDQNEQPIQYDQNEQPIQYDQNAQPIQYDQNEQPIQYDQNGQPIQYDQNGQPIQYDQNGQPIQYDENGQIIQYDENGQPIQYYDQQYDTQQPSIQYDETGKPLQGYEQQYQQYDDNGQPIYDQNAESYQGYDEGGQSHMYEQNPESYQYDEHGQPLQYDESGQIATTQENITDKNSAEYVGNDPYSSSSGVEPAGSEHAKSNAEHENVKPALEENIKEPPKKQNIVLDMLDTDTESVKQNTSKVSNDSDFDFSNG